VKGGGQSQIFRVIRGRHKVCRRFFVFFCRRLFERGTEFGEDCSYALYEVGEDFWRRLKNNGDKLVFWQEAKINNSINFNF